MRTKEKNFRAAFVLNQYKQFDNTIIKKKKIFSNSETLFLIGEFTRFIFYYFVILKIQMQQLYSRIFFPLKCEEKNRLLDFD